MAEQPPIMPGPAQGPATQPSSGLAIASMVLGIVAVVLFCIMYVSVPSAILAIVLGAIARKKAATGEAGGKSMATAGLICGAISLGLVILLSAGLFAILGIGGSKMMEEMQEEMQRQQTQPSGAVMLPTDMLHQLQLGVRMWMA